MKQMILALRTDSAVAEMLLFEAGGNIIAERRPELGRSMARDLLSQLEELLHDAGKTWPDIGGIVLFTGPGSFTGLRIGATVANTVAYAIAVPVVGTSGTNWSQEGVRRLLLGENDKLVMPHYGAEAHITQPRK